MGVVVARSGRGWAAKLGSSTGKQHARERVRKRFSASACCHQPTPGNSHAPQFPLHPMHSCTTCIERSAMTSPNTATSQSPPLVKSALRRSHDERTLAADGVSTPEPNPNHCNTWNLGALASAAPAELLGTPPAVGVGIRRRAPHMNDELPPLFRCRICVRTHIVLRGPSLPGTAFFCVCILLPDPLCGRTCNSSAIRSF